MTKAQRKAHKAGNKARKYALMNRPNPFPGKGGKKFPGQLIGGYIQG